MVDDIIDDRFSYLSTKISDKEKWNPSLKELIDYMKLIHNVIFDCDKEGNISIFCDQELMCRKVTL